MTLSEMKCTARTGPHVHLYTKLFSQDNLGQRGYFDTGLFYNTEEFTMQSNEQHKMLIQSLSFDKADSTIYRARLDNDELSIDMHQEPGQLCYAITLLTPDATLTVAPKTSLSLLLKSAQLHVTTYMVTEEVADQLKRPLQERDLVRSQVDTVRKAALNESSWGPKKYPGADRKDGLIPPACRGRVILRGGRRSVARVAPYYYVEQAARPGPTGNQSPGSSLFDI